MSGSLIATCDIRCHITCKTCDGTGSSDCTSCENGHVLSGGSCSATNSITRYVWIRGNAASNSWGDGNGNTYSYNRYIGSSGGAPSSTCGNYTSYWGYENQENVYATDTDTDNKYFGFNFAIFSNKYYAIEVKIELIFIDEFNEQGAVYVSRDSSTAAPVATWMFDTKEAYGESLCGDNRMDYVMMAVVQVPSINRTTETFYIRTN